MLLLEAVLEVIATAGEEHASFRALERIYAKGMYYEFSDYMAPITDTLQTRTLNIKIGTPIGYLAEPCSKVKGRRTDVVPAESV